MAAHNAASKNIRLDSWKAIASFFGKDERTVKRWEKERGLPVRRLPGAGRATVFAYTEELEQWLAGPQQAAPREGEESPSSVGPELAAKATSAEADEFTPGKQAERTDNARISKWRVLVWAVPLALLTVSLVYSFVGHSPIHFRRALAAHPQPDSTAQDLYLKGRFYFEKRTPADLNTAVDAFTQAIVHDPTYAQAYVGLADSYSLLREYSTMPTPDAEQRARAAAEKAVELDPNLAEAHTSLAFADFWGSLDVDDAQREFRRAIELEPNLARAHHWYATFLIEVQRPEEALAEIERARQLDPSSKAILADKGLLLTDAGRPEEGRTLLTQMEQSDPNFRSTHAYLARIEWDDGNYALALEELRKAALLQGQQQEVKDLEEQAAAFRSAGVPGLLQHRLAEAMRRYESGAGPAYNVARAFADLKKRNETMKYLELARQRREDCVADLETASEFNWMHGDPEFRQLVVNIGLPPLR
jgi:Tfp pilus assembly protein PilF